MSRACGKSTLKRIHPGEVARCRRVRDERDKRFKAIEAALAHFTALERHGARASRSATARRT